MTSWIFYENKFKKKKSKALFEGVKYVKDRFRGICDIQQIDSQN